MGMGPVFSEPLYSRKDSIFTCNFIGPVPEVPATHLFVIDLKQVSFILENSMSKVSVLFQCLHFDCSPRLLFLCVLVHI